MTYSLVLFFDVLKINLMIYPNCCRNQLLLQAAKELCCGKVFMAPTSTDLAIQILTDVSLGRGSLMHHDVVLNCFFFLM